jgi:hypothetical protein
VATPLHPKDGATLAQLTAMRDDVMGATKAEVKDVTSNALMLENDNYMAKKKRIIELAVPRNSLDATNKVYVDRNFLGLNEEKVAYDAQEKRVVGLAAPINPSDAANKEFVLNSCYSPVKFHAMGPMEAKSAWLANLTHQHVLTTPAKLMKAALFCSDRTSSIVISCKIGNEEFLISKSEGEWSTTTVYPASKVLEKDAIITVHNMNEFEKEDVFFQLDLYLVYTQ